MWERDFTKSYIMRKEGEIVALGSSDGSEMEFILVLFKWFLLLFKWFLLLFKLLIFKLLLLIIIINY